MRRNKGFAPEFSQAASQTYHPIVQRRLLRPCLLLVRAFLHLDHGQRGLPTQVFSAGFALGTGRFQFTRLAGRGLLLVDALRSMLAVEWILVDPMETPIDERELVPVDEFEFHVNFAAIHSSIHDEMVPRRTIEREACLPVFVAVLR